MNFFFFSWSSLRTFVPSSCLCRGESEDEDKKEKQAKLLSSDILLISFTQLNKNVILKLKNCGWNNKLNLSRFHTISLNSQMQEGNEEQVEKPFSLELRKI